MFAWQTKRPDRQAVNNQPATGHPKTMNVTYSCPQCESTACREVKANAALECPHCGHVVQISGDAMLGDQLQRCLVCPSKDLFVRKNFPQRLGVMIVVLGFAISCVTWYYRMVYATFGVLFATAAIDVVLYLLVGNVLECYRCQAQYRDVDGLDNYESFDLETHERHRQQKIRLSQ